jgi:hypothetical protein
LTYARGERENVTTSNIEKSNIEKLNITTLNRIKNIVNSNFTMANYKAKVMKKWLVCVRRHASGHTYIQTHFPLYIGDNYSRRVQQ